jgi:cyclohexyl-isocyanide hydratase
MADFNIGFVIFPGITQLDFTGPFEVLSRLGTPASISVPSNFPQARTHVVAKTMQPVVSDRGLAIMLTCTFDSSPPLDLICLRGGVQVLWMLSLMSKRLTSFISKAGAQATSRLFA